MNRKDRELRRDVKLEIANKKIKLLLDKIEGNTMEIENLEMSLYETNERLVALEKHLGLEYVEPHSEPSEPKYRKVK